MQEFYNPQATSPLDDAGVVRARGRLPGARGVHGLADGPALDGFHGRRLLLFVQRRRRRVPAPDPISAARAPLLLSFAALDCWCRPLEGHSKAKTNMQDLRSAAYRASSSACKYGSIERRASRFSRFAAFRSKFVWPTR